MTSIGRSAFYGCTGLTSVTLLCKEIGVRLQYGYCCTSDGQGREVVDAYQLNGLKRNGMQHGLNIVRMSDGTTRKVVVK